MSGHAERPSTDTGPPLNTVELHIAEGIDLLIYGPGPDFEVVEVSFVPAALLDEES
ncbi:hypothetical protein ACFV27_00910 [Streptomyces antimycoticus]|uniref:hypothetical protein n=1 Tax=Streptomyces antimycoticus TaxID=68175 RepID=UPI0036CC0603